VCACACVCARLRVCVHNRFTKHVVTLSPGIPTSPAFCAVRGMGMRLLDCEGNRNESTVL